MLKTPIQSLEELAKLTGLSTKNATIEGTDPVYPLPQRAVAAGTAALAAAGLAAADLWEMKTGRRQQISINTRAAAPSLRSVKLLKLNGVPARESEAHGHPTRGFYRVRNGRWIYLHCSFSNIRERNLRVLGDDVTDRADAEKAAISWDGEELEEAIFARGGACSLVRSEDEWNELGQARAVARLPLLEIVKIGDAPPQPLPEGGAQPLSGLKALDLTRVLAGPTAARTLAEFGADVMKISREGLPHGGLPDFDAELGKLSAYLDLRQPREMETLVGLIKQSDVFIEAYRPGTLAGRGLSMEDVVKIKPGIIFTTLSAWGHEGPWRDRRGFDTVVQSANGMAWKGADTRPELMSVASMDYVAGYLMAVGTMIALARRAREGGSWLVRTSLAGTGHWIRQHGLNDAASLSALPAELPDDELQAMMRDGESVVGPVRYLGPALKMSETPLRLDRASVPIGFNKPIWPSVPGGPGLPAAD